MNEDKVSKAISALKDCSGIILNNESIIKDLEDMLKPERIYGLTMDEWQVVIGGGYLCEYSQNTEHFTHEKIALEIIKDGDVKGRRFRSVAATSSTYSNCRPYRAVGHVQPYFDNDECREYLEGLSDDALIFRHFEKNNFWGAGPLKASTLRGDWFDCDKFIVLEADGGAG